MQPPSIRRDTASDTAHSDRAAPGDDQLGPRAKRSTRPPADFSRAPSAPPTWIASPPSTCLPSLCAPSRSRSWRLPSSLCPTPAGLSSLDPEPLIFWLTARARPRLCIWIDPAPRPRSFGAGHAACVTGISSKNCPRSSHPRRSQRDDLDDPSRRSRPARGSRPAIRATDALGHHDRRPRSLRPTPSVTATDDLGHRDRRPRSRDRPPRSPRPRGGIHWTHRSGGEPRRGETPSA